MEYLPYIAGFCLIGALIAFYYNIIKPVQDEKALKKEEAERTAAKYAGQASPSGCEKNYKRLESVDEFWPDRKI